MLNVLLYATGCGILSFLLSDMISHKIVEYKLTKKQKLEGLLYGVIIGGLFGYVMDGTNVIWLFLALAPLLAVQILIDKVYQELPDILNYQIFILSVLYIFVFHEGSFIDNLLSFPILFIGFFLIAIISGALGGGDIKLMGAIALFFPYQNLLSLLMVGFGTGCLFGLYLVLVKKVDKKSMFAFGPFLIIGIIATLLMQFPLT